jgi:U3 small nucleolar RNA-associated protein 13
MSGLHTQLLDAHSDIVLCLASGSAPSSASAGFPPSSSKTLLMSGSKDGTARLWLPIPSTSLWTSVAICTGHLESIGAVALPRCPTSLFSLTASQDRTIKLWDLSPLVSSSQGGEIKLQSLLTQKIHERDINALDVSPDDQMVASGSQDKTAKIFSLEVNANRRKGRETTASLTLKVVLKGHKRGVWSVKFSNRDRVLATASGDRTVKLWGIEDGDCLKVCGIVVYREPPHRC